MGSDEEYLDDFISSLMKEEEGEGLAPSEEGKEGFGLEEGSELDDVDFALEDFAPEEFDAGDFALEDFVEEGSGLEADLEESAIDDMMEGLLDDIPEDFPDESALEELPEEPALEDLPEEPALEDLPEEPALEDLPEEPALEDLPEEPVLEDIPEEPVLEDLPEEGSALEDTPDEEPAFDDLGLSDLPVDEMESEGFNNEEESLISPDEVDAMFAAADAAADMDTNSSEEDDLFDADMQTDEIFDFLDGMQEEEENSGEFEDLGIGGMQEMPTEEDQEEPKKKKKEKKKEKKSLFGKKKGKKSGEENTEEGDTESVDKSEDDADGEKEKKSQGFFSRIMAFLTEADDEDSEEGKADGLEPSDENKNILKELDDEDKNKKKKKVKAKGDEEGKEKKEKKKKEKKEKKKKEKPAAADSEGSETVKKGKRVSIKSILVIAAFCLTVTAMVIVTCSIIPDFFDKREAREAFYQSDYIKSYELMYGKKLDESDAIIYNKAKTILEMKRKLDSYHNYLAMGKDVQALDALMSGVEHYPEILAKAEEFRVTQEVNAIYESILNILNDKYSLAEPVAQTIIAYDDVTYTKRLESIVYNTPFIMPEEKTEKEEVATTADILPEEQELLEEEQLPNTEEQELPQEAPLDEMAEDDLPQEEDMAQQEPENAVAEPSAEDPAIDESVAEPSVQEGNNSQGEDVSTWTGNSGFGSQGEQIQGIRQPIDVEIHGN